MLFDDREYIRKIAVSKIIEARKNEKEGTIRRFKIPPLNFNANDYIELINWENNQVTEPLITSKIDQEILKQVKYNVFYLFL